MQKDTSEVLFKITEDIIQDFAGMAIDRELTKEEMERFFDGFFAGDDAMWSLNEMMCGLIRKIAKGQ